MKGSVKMERVIILAKKSYDFTNDDGRVKGCKIMYLTDENNNEEELMGHTPFIVSISDDIICDKVDKLPALYDLSFSMKMGKNNKPEIALKDVKFVKELDLTQLFK